MDGFTINLGVSFNFRPLSFGVTVGVASRNSTVKRFNLSPIMAVFLFVFMAALISASTAHLAAGVAFIVTGYCLLKCMGALPKKGDQV